jgi:hypothetical protein
MWVLHLGMILHLNLQYMHLYLFLPTKILGFYYNTCNCTYFYQLEFWGLIVIFAFVLTSTNWDLGLVTISAFNINIITILVFLHFKLFVFIAWKQ